MPGKTKRHQRKKPRVPPIVLVAILAIVIIVPTTAMGVSFQMEDRDSFCASCHTQPEETYYQRSIASTQVDLASAHKIKSVRCIDCHSGAGLSGRLGAIYVGTGDLVRWVTHTARQPAPVLYPIHDGNCLKCHAATPATQDFNRHFHAFLSKWQAIDPNAAGCVDCHTSHTTDGDPSLGFLQQERTVAVCQRCHQAVGAGG